MVSYTFVELLLVLKQICCARSIVEMLKYEVVFSMQLCMPLCTLIGVYGTLIYPIRKARLVERFIYESLDSILV
eukprot:XP_001709093.1 Hypothetical protein GL50803_102303 [Giardia lamblia ATCC 50803]